MTIRMSSALMPVSSKRKKVQIVELDRLSLYLFAASLNANATQNLNPSMYSSVYRIHTNRAR